MKEGDVIKELQLWVFVVEAIILISFYSSNRD